MDSYSETPTSPGIAEKAGPPSLTISVRLSLDKRNPSLTWDGDPWKCVKTRFILCSLACAIEGKLS